MIKVYIEEQDKYPEYKVHLNYQLWLTDYEIELTEEEMMLVKQYQEIHEQYDRLIKNKIIELE